MGIIFDLDQTLVDSSLAEIYRGKNWRLAFDQIPNFTYYPGLQDIFDFIAERNIQTCIVTNSISSYCAKVTDFWGIRCDFHICYHDTMLRKPHPEPILKAIERFGCDPNKVLSVGDRSIDIEASTAAGVRSVACLWGAADKISVLASEPTYVANTPAQLLAIIQAFFEEY